MHVVKVFNKIYVVKKRTFTIQRATTESTFETVSILTHTHTPVSGLGHLALVAAEGLVKVAHALVHLGEGLVLRR
jgi:hypothetical protein